ncbi:MAG TPA: DUF5666 domain-containing protein [Verrucomicrobiae bacterium]|jgi:Cu/Ag efflux protein CusF|nr:DUF5666 domain-containing protein [Verrucomicrobiae bacterium]
MFNRFCYVVIILASLALVGGAHAAGKSKTGSGTIYVIDDAGGTITIKNSSGAFTTVNVTRKSKISRNKKKTTLGGLVLGDDAKIVFDNSNNVKQIGASGPVVSTVSGGVDDVNSGTGEVHFENGSFVTDSSTRVVRNGKVTSLNALTILDKITAHVVRGSSLSHSSELQIGDDNAIDIQAEGPEEAEVRGTIAAVGATTVTITPKAGGADVTVNVTADTLIAVSGSPVAITALAVGSPAEAEYDPTTLNAFRIEAENEVEDAEVEGLITAIDTAAGTVTITDALANPITLFVDASTRIERNDAPATIFDLQINDPVKAEYNDVTLVANEIEVEAEVNDNVGDDHGAI